MKKEILTAALAVAATFVSAQNPYLPLWEHLPDGEPRVFDDPDNPGKKRAYIVGSHDVKYTEYCGNDIRIWSAPVDDLTDWRDEGPVFSHYVNGEWDTMFAPDLVEVADKTTGKKTYWLYPHSRGWRRVPMVCKSDRPDGPFTPVNLNAEGTACVEGSLIDFDPSVFVENITDKKDPDFSRGFRAYVYYGFRHSTAYELDQDNMYAVRPGTEIHDYFIPASERYGVIRDPEGTQYPALCKGQNPGDFNFFEASSIRKVGNKYIMVFSGYSGPDYGLGSTNSALRYAYGDSPLGPWRSGGVLVDSRGVVPDENGQHLVGMNAAHNTHGSIQEINGQWYVFYHRPPRGFGFARQAMVAPVKIVWDKKPVAKGGKVTITAYDPYAKDNEWTAEAADGTRYTGAEVTSEGFNIFGLPPYAYYSAGIACYMTDQRWLQDNFDVWNNGMTLANVADGGIVGFKYFGFGGLQQHTKGIKPFCGTKQGDDTRLFVALASKGKGAARIRVMLDGPYANETWNGKEIAVIDIKADASKEVKMYDVAVPAVEGLSGKHAIYLRIEGEGKEGLVDIYGIGFGKDGEPCKMPVVPEVKILVDGKPVAMPALPLFSTNRNGLMDLTHYQLYAPLKPDSKINVVVEGAEIKTEVGRITDGRAKVRCSYNGKEKVFLIN